MQKNHCLHVAVIQQQKFNNQKLYQIGSDEDF